MPINIPTCTGFYPGKRNQPGATSEISNIALKITQVLDSCLETVCEVNGTVTKEGICDTIRNQWMAYQNEEIPEDFYLTPEEELPKTARVQESYWCYALEEA